MQSRKKPLKRPAIAGTIIPKLVSPAKRAKSAAAASALASTSSNADAAHLKSKQASSENTPESTIVRRVPEKFSILEDMFCSLELVLTQHEGTRALLTLDNATMPVTRATGFAFTWQHLAQMNSVLPSAYVFRVENFGERGAVDEKVVILRGSPTGKTTPALLMGRRVQFQSGLTALVRAAYERFRSAKALPPDDGVSDWHADFCVDEAVPDILLADFPDVSALRKERRPAPASPIKTKMPPLEPLSVLETSASPIPAELKGLNADFIMKIRAREATLEELKKQETPQFLQKKTLNAGLLPLAELVRQIFAENRKISSMEVSSLITRIVYANSEAKELVKKQLETLCEILAPIQWCEIVRGAAGQMYFVVNKSVSFAEVQKRVLAHVKEPTL